MTDEYTIQELYDDIIDEFKNDFPHSAWELFTIEKLEKLLSKFHMALLSFPSGEHSLYGIIMDSSTGELYFETTDGLQFDGTCWKIILDFYEASRGLILNFDYSGYWQKMFSFYLETV